MAHVKSKKQTKIAVVGASALFPGSVSPQGFWQDILAGKDLLTDIPETHWLAEDYYDENPSAPDKTYARRGGFLDKVNFDVMEWGIPPAIVPATDTSQLLALIVAKQVLDDASKGQFAQMDRSKTSVVIGVTSAQELLCSMVSRLQRPVWVKSMREAGLGEDQVQKISDAIAGHYTPWQESTFPGLLGNVVAGRIANRLDLGGTNCVTDAACASAFSAVSLGVNELLTNQSDLVLVGGVDTLNDPFMYMCFSKTPALSKSGDCRPFSDSADGTMLGEGIGMVALKRLEDAERDGDAIYAVLSGVGTSSDGRSKSVYAPVSEGQAKALRRAYDQAGYTPDTVELMEAHGTGTKAGDAAEFGGLNMVFGETGREQKQWCALGSVKSQIGHTKAAAGAAGLFKIIMALRHKTLPPTIKIEKPSQKLNIEETPFYLNTETRPWVRDGNHPRRGSVSAFGFGGSNYHLTLEEYTGSNELAGRFRTNDQELVVISGGSIDEVVATIADFSSHCQYPGALSWLSWRSCSNWNGSGDFRLAVLAKDEQDLVAKLTAAADKLKNEASDFNLPGVWFGAGQKVDDVAYLFPGQGSQYVNMGNQVAMAFDEAIGVWGDISDAVVTEKPLHSVVYPIPGFSDDSAKEQQSKLTETQWAQPAIGAVSLSILSLLEKMKVSPKCVGGHSFGEVTALHAAGVFSRSDMMKVAHKRGELMAAAASVTSGSMTAVPRPIEEVRDLVAEFGLDVVVANHNSPNQVILSGSTEAIDQAEKNLKKKKIRARRLPVATAFHSSIVADSTEPFEKFLSDISFQKAHIPVFSNTTATPYPSTAKSRRQRLSGQIAKSVRFVEQIEAMYKSGVRTFVEVGPGSVLTNLTGQILENKPHKCIATDRKGQNGLQSLLEAVGSMFAGGLVKDLDILWSGYRVPENPTNRAEQKMTIKINGSNYGKPYPPEGGAKVLPQPNANVKPVEDVPLSAPAVRDREPVVSAAAMNVARRDNKSEISADSTVLPSHSKSMANKGKASSMEKKHQPQAKPVNAPVAASEPSAAMLQQFYALQKQTADAQAAYQKAMAESHSAFLKTMEAGFKHLQGLQPKVAVEHNHTEAPTEAPSFEGNHSVSAPLIDNLVPNDSRRSVSETLLTAKQHVVPNKIVTRQQKMVPEVTQVRPERSAFEAAKEAVPQMATATPKANARQAMRVDASAILLSIVANKTGYPESMLSLDMNLESDLGIDSIKRVEIMSALTEENPAFQDVDANAMGGMSTLGEITAWLQQQVTTPEENVSASPETVVVDSTPQDAAPVTSSAVSASAQTVNGDKLLFSIVAEKTGYPEEMLAAEMDLEGDLGIDSIKRVEILSALSEADTAYAEIDANQMAGLRTLGEISAYLLQHIGTLSSAPVVRASDDTPDLVVSLEPQVDTRQHEEVNSAGDIPLMDVRSILLEVVADKTGYPGEMLAMEMNLEGDLGIDSIKRVEILSALVDKEPRLPEPDAGQMGALQTLGEIVSYLESLVPSKVKVSEPLPAEPLVLEEQPHISETTNQPPVVAADEQDIAALLLRIVADKTGYPANMLTQEMNLEGDLGIDSIKRVEILSAFTESYGSDLEPDGQQMSALQTLGEITEFLQQTYAVSNGGGIDAFEASEYTAPSPKTEQKEGRTPVDISAVLLNVIAQKTGYPVEALFLHMNLESDLGIDSIKRVEILSSLCESMPELPEPDNQVLSGMQTLKEIAIYLDQIWNEVQTDQSNPVQEVREQTATILTAGSNSAVATAHNEGVAFGRWSLNLEPAPSVGMVRHGLLGQGIIWITDAGALTEALVQELKGRGIQVVTGKQIPSQCHGIIELSGMNTTSSVEEAIQLNRDAFSHARQLANQNQNPGVFITIQNTGGSFGLDNLEEQQAWLGGIPGLAKTFAQEFPGASVKAIDISVNGTLEAQARMIAEELFSGGPELEVAINERGRFTLKSAMTEVVTGEHVLEADDVVVASGGARGVTAGSLIELGRATRCRFVLLGRTPLVEEPACCVGLTEDGAMKHALLQEAQRIGQPVTPMEIGRRVSKINANREICKTLETLEAAGCHARYEVCDVTSKASLDLVLGQVRNDWGPIKAIVHGAGVIQDRMIKDKSAEQFNRVFDTKVMGLKALLVATAGDPLKVICLFSSVAGRAGNAGQCDYAMANEILNKVANFESKQRSGCLVKSLGWGPWAGGMVTPELEAHFGRAGVPLIGLGEGANMLVSELQSTQTSQVELVMGGLPEAKPLISSDDSQVLSLDVLVNEESHPYLKDHMIDGKVVLPVVLVLEWFSRAVRVFRPMMQVSALENLKVLRGVKLEGFQRGGDMLIVVVKDLGGDQLGLELKGLGGQLYFSAQVSMVLNRGESKIQVPAIQVDDRQDPVYGGVLFHGSDFQVIKTLDGVSQEGTAALLHGVVKQEWPKEQWQTDVAAFDGGLQLALLWSEHVLGGSSLPTSIGRVIPFTDKAPSGAIRCVLKGQKVTGNKALSDLVFVDDQNQPVAEFTGVETHLLPGRGSSV